MATTVTRTAIKDAITTGPTAAVTDTGVHTGTAVIRPGMDTGVTMGTTGPGMCILGTTIRAGTTTSITITRATITDSSPIQNIRWNVSGGFVDGVKTATTTRRLRM